MTSLFLCSEWRSLMTTIAYGPRGDDSPRRAAAALLHASGHRVRAAYIRSCCSTNFSETVVDSILPEDFHPALVAGWVPQGELLCYWDHGFVVRVHGPLAIIQQDLPWLTLREPLYQLPGVPAVITISDRRPVLTEDADGHQRWTWGRGDESWDEDTGDLGPLLPASLFDLLPWPPMFDSVEAATAALSSALISEAHELAQVSA